VSTQGEDENCGSNNPVGMQWGVPVQGRSSGSEIPCKIPDRSISLSWHWLALQPGYWSE